MEAWEKENRQPGDPPGVPLIELLKGYRTTETYNPKTPEIPIVTLEKLADYSEEQEARRLAFKGKHFTNAELTKLFGLASSGAVSNAAAKGDDYFMGWSAKYDLDGVPWSFEGTGKNRKFFRLEFSPPDGIIAEAKRHAENHAETLPG